MRQTRALLVDAYRELQAKKMFWVVLILNVAVIGVFAILGVNGQSLTVLWYEVGDTRRIGLEPIFLYKYAFSAFIVGLWFTWAATLLALISTAGIFPDFMSSGAVDLFLAKPISRLRLFFTKYLAGLLFVASQVTIFTTLSFLVLGVRAGIWQAGLFFAIPIVLVFFSYLYAVCVLLGTVTRSTIAAFLLTMLAWTGFWLVDYIDRQVAIVPVIVQAQQNDIANQLSTVEKQIELETKTPSEDSEKKLAALDMTRGALLKRRDTTITPHAVETAQQVLFGIKSVVPKTRDTIVLLDRVLFSDADLKDLSKQGTEQAAPETAPAARRGRGGPDFAMQSAQLQNDRVHSAWWIIGTSLIFEAVCLALAAWHFCTRDF
jgi:ABC-type transport system involved in multi-copper enzyme maturation permease subunit